MLPVGVFVVCGSFRGAKGGAFFGGGSFWRNSYKYPLVLTANG